jgi:hypothetical protein
VRVPAALACFLLFPALAAAGPDEARLEMLVGDWDRFAEIEAMGADALPVLARIYERTPDPDRRAELANVFYRLGLESADAKRVLQSDLHTEHRNLRLSVQWALGRVSGDDDVVPQLLEIMRNDGDALFRDKAACALAHDQVHLDATERLPLLEGLVDALEDEKAQVRAIAIKALQIHTGQTRGFRASAPPAERAAKVAEWRRWLTEYAAQAR